MLTIVLYPKCSTCKKTVRFLEDNHVVFESRDIKEENPSVEELKKWHKMSGLPLKKFFNTSGLKYKELGLKERLAGMREEEQYQLLASDGMLVKRPILVGDDFILVAFQEAAWNEKIK